MYPPAFPTPSNPAESDNSDAAIQAPLPSSQDWQCPPYSKHPPPPIHPARNESWHPLRTSAPAPPQVHAYQGPNPPASSVPPPLHPSYAAPGTIQHSAGYAPGYTAPTLHNNNYGQPPHSNAVTGSVPAQNYNAVQNPQPEKKSRFRSKLKEKSKKFISEFLDHKSSGSGAAHSQKPPKPSGYTASKPYNHEKSHKENHSSGLGEHRDEHDEERVERESQSSSESSSDSDYDYDDSD